MSRASRATHRTTESNNRNLNAAEEKIRELKAYTDNIARMTSAARAEANVENRYGQALRRKCAEEEAMQSVLQQQQKNRVLTERDSNQNQALIDQLSLEFITERRRVIGIQRICDDSDELKDLERKLKTAYLNKERAAQCVEKGQLTARDRDMVYEMDRQMENNRQRAILAEKEMIGARMQVCREQHHNLEDQIREKENRIHEKKQLMIADRKLVDDIVNRINQEDEDDYRKRKDSQAAMAKIACDAEEQRKRQVEIAQAAAKDEEERIAAYNRSLIARNEGIAADRQDRYKEEAEVLQKKIDAAALRKREAEEYEALCITVHEHEVESRKRADLEARRHHQSLMQRNIMDANAQLISCKAEMRRIQVVSDTRAVEAMRKKFADDEAKERIAEEQRARRKLEQLSYLREQQAEKKGLYDAECAKELLLIQLENRKEEYRRRVVQEARRRLLEEHATKLIGYLPKKVFNDTDEYSQYQGQQQRQTAVPSARAHTR